jgi:hypothetical protein
VAYPYVERVISPEVARICLDGEAFARSSCQQAGAAARIRFEFGLIKNDNKESKVELAITPTYYETKTRLIDAS